MNFKLENFISNGWYQILHFVVYQWITIVHTINLNMMTFGKIEPSRTCLDGNYSLQANFTICENISISSDFHSVVAEFDLYGDRIFIVYLSISLQMLGVAIGSIFFGYFADRFGRKWVLFVAFALQILVGASSVVSPSWETFLTFRLCLGFMCGGTVSTNYVYLVEFLTTNFRLPAICIGGWPVGFAFLALAGYLTRNWKTLSLWCNIFGIPCLLCLCFLPESPHWLFQRGRYESLKKSLNYISKINQRQTDFEQLTSFLEYQTVKLNAKKQNIMKLLTASIAKAVLTLAFCSFVMTIVLSGLIFDQDNLVGDRYLNLFYYAILRSSSSIVTLLISMCFKSCGRKQIFIFSSSSISLLCIIVAVLKAINGSGSAIMGLVLAIGLMCSPLWISVTIVSAEVFPTSIRNIASSFCAVFNNIGGISAPQILLLAYLWPPSPYILFAVLSSISGIVFLIFIKETKGHALPEEDTDDKITA